MKFHPAAALCCWLLTFAAGGQASILFAQTRSVGVDSATGAATMVIVDNQPLTHTAQLLPYDSQGMVAAGDLALQTAQVLENLKSALGDAGTNHGNLVRLNVYLAREELAPRVQKLLSEKLMTDVHPVITCAVTPLPHKDALLALDAVAAAPDSQGDTVSRVHKPNLEQWYGTSHVAVLPRGRAVYISGMAANEDDLAASAAGTMQQLHSLLQRLGLDASHVVHVKAFMRPMSDVASARAAMKRFYPDQAAPPMTFVEWSDGLPIEIEMIASLPGQGERGQAVQHRWRSEEKRSPVFCRYAVVSSPKRIYISGLRSRSATGPESQVRDIFTQLQQALQAADSDLRHLVKATYYVTDAALSKPLGQVRTELYDPRRPPAASKATIAGTGEEGRSITIDMIAVPKQN